MQIRLTVLGPRGGRAARGFDVLVTAPEGTPLGKVAGALASAAGSGQPGGRSSAASAVLYAGPDRLSPAAVLGVPPLVDGALLSLHAPAEPPGDHGRYGSFGRYGRPPAELARLHVIGGPDAGGVHLLQGGQARIGRSADADVPLDDPDVSRLHCEVAVGPDGQVTVADLGSTNGTVLAGRLVGPRPQPFPPGALLRIGESTLRLDPPHSPAPPPLPSHPDGDGHLRVALRDARWTADPAQAYGAVSGDAAGDTAGRTGGSGAYRTGAHGTAGAHGGGSHGTGASGAGASGAGASGAGLGGAIPGQVREGSARGGPGREHRAGDSGAAVPYDADTVAHGRGGYEAGASGAGGDRGGVAVPDQGGAAGRGAGRAGFGGPAGGGAGAAGGGRPAAGAGGSGEAAQAPGRVGAFEGRAEARGGTAGHGAGGAAGSGASAGAGPGSGPARGHGGGAAGAEDHRRAGSGSDQDGPGDRGSEPATAAGAAYATAGGPRQDPYGGAGRPAAGDAHGPGAGPDLEDGGRAGGALDGDPEGVGRRPTGERARPGAEAGRARGVGAIGAWARRRFTGGRTAAEAGDGGEAEALRERWPDPAAVLLTALGPGRRLWERSPSHPDALTVRLGTADLPSEDGARRLPAVPFTVDLRAPGTSALTLAGPRPRLAGLARAVLAQLCALHSPAALEVVLLSADRTRGADQRAEEWSWLNWLPHLRPAHGQDCRLLLAFDRDQAEARAAEVVRRLEAGPLGPSWASATREAVAAAAGAYAGAFTLLVVDGDPGSAALRETVARIAAAGPSAGVHVLCLAETGERPVVAQGLVARLSGDVATTLRIGSADRPDARAGSAAAGPGPDAADEVVLDAVSADWAEHFARALAPLREADADAPGARSRHALPAAVRLLDELDLAVATPAKIGARWSAAPPGAPAATAVLGAGAGGRIAVDLVAEGPHALVGGAAGAGKTELLRSLAAALATGERPGRLALILVDGAGQARGEGLAACADLPHVSAHLSADDPVRMREFAQALTAELRQRAELLAGRDFGVWHAERQVAATVPHQRADTAREGIRPAPGGPALPRLVIVVDDFDALVAPALGAPGRPSAGSVVRALEAVARDGERLGVHLVAATGRPERTAGTDTDERAPLRIALRMADPESAALVVHVEDPASLDDAVPGRGYLRRPGGAVTAFQTGRVSARIPRTATLRPTVVAVEWERMGDPPARRQVRELGNGPTDLALLASALQRAADSAPPA